jgi:hypothetical protein
LYIGAWKQVFEQYNIDFPNQYVSLSHGNDVALPNPHNLRNPPAIATTRNAVIHAGATMLTDFQHQFAYQSSALSGKPSHHDAAIKSVIQDNGKYTTGFQLGGSAEDSPGAVGAKANPPLALKLAIENGVQPRKKNGEHVDYIEVHSDDVVNAESQPVLELQPVLKWAASLLSVQPLNVRMTPAPGQSPDGESLRVNVTFSEPVTDFNSAKLEVGDGYVGALSGHGRHFSFRLFAYEPFFSTTVSIPVGTVTDQSGQANRTAAQVRFTWVLKKGSGLPTS